MLQAIIERLSAPAILERATGGSFRVGMSDAQEVMKAMDDDIDPIDAAIAQCKTQMAVLVGEELFPCATDKDVAAMVRRFVGLNQECEVLWIENGRGYSHNIIEPDMLRSLKIGDEVMIRTPLGSESWCKVTGMTNGGRLSIIRKGKSTYDWPHNIMVAR